MIIEIDSNKWIRMNFGGQGHVFDVVYAASSSTATTGLTSHCDESIADDDAVAVASDDDDDADVDDDDEEEEETEEDEEEEDDVPIMEGTIESICTLPITSRKNTSSMMDVLIFLSEATRSMRRSKRSLSMIAPVLAAAVVVVVVDAVGADVGASVESVDTNEVGELILLSSSLLFTSFDDNKAAAAAAAAAVICSRSCRHANMR